MKNSKKERLILYCLLFFYSNFFATETLDFTDINRLFDQYIYTLSANHNVNRVSVVNPSLQLLTYSSQRLLSLGIEIDTNSIYSNLLKKKANEMQQEYSYISSVFFSYDKINGDFFTLLSFYYEDEFLKSNEIMDEIDIESRLSINHMYEDMLKKTIYNYSGITIDDKLIRKYISILNDYDFSSFKIDDVEQIGILKETELLLQKCVAEYNQKNKQAYGYLPVFTIDGTVSSSDTLSEIQTNCSFGLEIPNLGIRLKSNFTFSTGELIPSYEVSFRLPISKRNLYELAENEYSFASEMFLLDLKSNLILYKSLANKETTESKYELVQLKPRLLYAIKKYMELY